MPTVAIEEFFQKRSIEPIKKDKKMQSVKSTILKKARRTDADLTSIYPGTSYHGNTT